MPIGRRWAIHILGDLLELLAESPGQVQTSLRDHANLNTEQAHVYLNYLLEQGFVAKREAFPVVYDLTDRGHEVLLKIKDLLTTLGVELLITAWVEAGFDYEDDLS